MATTTMNISLTPELAKMIQDKVDSGMFSNASEVVRDALRSKQEHADYIYEIKLERLKAALAPGLEQADRGEYKELTAQDIIDRLDSRNNHA